MCWSDDDCIGVKFSGERLQKAENQCACFFMICFYSCRRYSIPVRGAFTPFEGVLCKWRVPVRFAGHIALTSVRPTAVISLTHFNHRQGTCKHLRLLIKSSKSMVDRDSRLSQMPSGFSSTNKRTRALTRYLNVLYIHVRFNALILHKDTVSL